MLAGPELQKPDAVIFDLDGTLLDTEPLYTQATNKVVEPFGKIFDMALKRRIMGGDSRVSAAIVIEALELPLTVDDFLEQRGNFLMELFAEAPEIRGAGDFVTSLKQQQIPIGLATSSERDLCELKLSRHDWYALFDQVICGDDPRLKNPKPAPDIFLLCAAEMAIAPDKCMAFEDSPNGIESGLAANMTVIAVGSPYVNPGDLDSAAAIVADLHQAMEMFSGW
jgi:HAD superfamily hydrolase (TIGR01509 family)